MKRALLCLVLIGLTTTALVAGTKIQTQRNETFKFATLKT